MPIAKGPLGDAKRNTGTSAGNAAAMTSASAANESVMTVMRGGVVLGWWIFDAMRRADGTR